MVAIPDRINTAGIPSASTEDITDVVKMLLAGDIPAYFTEDRTASADIAALTPVTVAVNGTVAVAADGTPADGVTLIAIASGKAGPIIRGGCLNHEAITWPASYNTEAKKINAFAGAKSPTQITVRRPKTLSV